MKINKKKAGFGPYFKNQTKAAFTCTLDIFMMKYFELEMF